MSKKLTTKYGVEIPTDANGNPLCDAPGKYDRFAAAMGSPTEHRRPRSAYVLYDLYWRHDATGLWADSQTWTDDGAPLPYRLTCDNDTGNWTATFEGSIIEETATLEECILACLSFDEHGDPDPDRRH